MNYQVQLLLLLYTPKVLGILLGYALGQTPLQNEVSKQVLASLPLITPIQNVSLLDYALTHKTVNSASDIEINASSGLTASSDDTYIIDPRKVPSRSQDLYTSDEQRRRDQYEIDEDNWHEVALEEVNGTSTCRLALHYDWIINHGYAVDGIVAMNLPEQGISGPFKITAIKHILPQKRPVDEDPDDEWEYRPVTGLFTHRSNQVHTLAFASEDDSQIDTLGVTAAHPIFSTTHHDWRLAGELEAGEKVLTYYGEATVLSNERKPGNEYVYNLEVKDLHNFLVGDVSVVVHNVCSSNGPCDWLWDVTHKYGSTGWESALQHIWNGHSFKFGKPLGTKSYFNSLFDKDSKIKDLVTEMTQDWGKFKKGEGTLFDFKEYANGDVRFVVDYSSKPHLLDAKGFIGYDKNGNGLTKVRVTLTKDFKIYNAFPANTIE